jgi:ABC-type antimicrobial peptide transport system permease subunit
VAFKGDHFTTGEWEKEELQVYFDYATENNPMVNLYYTNGSMVLNQDGTPKLANYFTISSSRLTFYSIIGFISNLLNTFLNVLGILIITTGLLLITNIQLMSVEDREFQTGVLRAVGDNKRGILVKYLIETVVQGLVGGFLGLFGGLIFGWTVAFYLSGLFGTGSGSVNPIIPPELVFLSLFLGVLIAIITGIFPAIRASNVNIVEALRGIKTEFSDKSSRNLMLLGVFISLIGLRFILDNGLFNTDNQYIWDTAGWNSIAEQENIVLGLGVFLSGLSIVLTRFIDRIKALNIMAITLWGLPIYSYLVTLKWVDANSGSSFSSFLLITIIEIVIGSVLFLGINLSPFMDVLRNFLIRFNVSKGIAQVAPNLIKSHKTRSTLTFAIFAVILTLNVTIATMVATQSQQTVGQANEDSRGVDLYVKLSEPEVTTHSYKTLIQNLDSRITDVIPFRTCTQCIKAGEPFIVSLRDPTSQNYNPNTDVLPMQIIETTKSQIIGNISENQPIVDQKWRYDFYLASDIVNGFPEDVREKFKDSMNDDQKNLLSKESWNLLFNESYSMTAYNISSLADFGGDNGGGFGSFNQELTEALKIKDENNKTVKNPIVFTDSFILPVGIQIWLPMNGSGFETKFQRFTVGGNLDSQRAGGFPFSPQQFGSGGFSDISVVGSILLPEQWAKYTAYFGDATGATAKRDPMAYDKFMIKTSLSIDDPKILDIAIAVEEFTNTPNQGYQQLIGDDLIQASAITIYSSLSETLEAMNQITSFLQIYVSFGLVIGSLGMAIIAVRNVAERKREIGMMRAIGFPRSQVMLAVLLELFVLGIIGLIIGIVNGLLINYGLSELSGGAIVVPWNTIIIYLGFITVVATIAGALPGWFAARIPASEALRYVG